MNTFLLIQTAFIGDAVLLTSLVETIKRQQPQSKIDVLVRKGNEVFFEKNKNVGDVLIWDKKNQKYFNLLKILTQIRTQKYKYCINLQRFAATGFVTAFSQAKTKIGFKNNPFSWSFTHAVEHIIGDGRHEIERNGSLLIPIFGEITPEKPKLYIPTKIWEETNQFKQEDYVCMFPGSVWFTKQLPIKKWVELIKKIPKNQKIYLMGAPNEISLCKEIETKSQRKNLVNLCGRLCLMQSASIISSAKMNYVNDSAPLHIASSLNAPVTAFFCSTVPHFGFTPLSDNATIVQHSGQLTCKPCGLHGKAACPEGHFRCGNEIELN